MRKTVFIISLLILSQLLNAQRGNINGSITAAGDDAAIPYASVVLLQNGTVTNYGAVSDDEGNLNIGKVGNGRYALIVSFIGYSNDTIHGIEISWEEPVYNVGQVVLSPAEFALKGAEVTAMAKTSSTQIDRKTYRAGDFETATGGTAVDLLGKLPSVSVTPDGEVSVRGTSDFMVYLNGKPTRIEPSVLLSQISTDNIEKVEVISVPTSKFDAQGKGGIINISTKTTAQEGLTVTANGTGGGAPWGHRTDRYSEYLNNDYRYNGTLGLIYSKEKLNLYSGLNYSMRNVNGNRTGDARILNPVTGAYKHMVAEGERPELYENFSASAGFDYDLTPGSNLSGSYYLGKRIEGRSAFYIYRILNADENKAPVQGVPTDENWIYNPNTDNRYGIFQSMNIDYSVDLGKGSNLKMSLLYENSGLSRILNNYNYDYDPVTDQAGAMMDHYNQEDDTPLHGYRLMIDYTRVFENGHTIEAGIQPQLFNINGGFSYDTLDLLSNEMVDFATMENNIALSRNIYAAYMMYSGQVEKLKFSAGLRTELLNQDFEIENSNYFSIFNSGDETSFTLNRLDLFPTAHLSYDLGRNKLILAASRRNSNPPIKNMAPFLYRRHLEVYVVGDPGLQPEYSNLADLTYAVKIGKHSIALTGFYREVENAVYRVNTVYYDEMVLIRSYTNSGSTRSAGVELNSNFEIGNSSKMFLGGSLYNFRVQGEAFGYKEDNSSNNWSLKGAYNLNFSKQLRWSTDFDMQSATVTTQGRNEMFYFLNSSLSYNPVRLENWSFNLKGLDLLSSNEKGLETRAYNDVGEQIFFQETTYFRYGPIAELGIVYSFNSGGKKMREAKSEFGSKEF